MLKLFCIFLRRMLFIEGPSLGSSKRLGMSAKKRCNTFTIFLIVHWASLPCCVSLRNSSKYHYRTHLRDGHCLRSPLDGNNTPYKLGSCPHCPTLKMLFGHHWCLQFHILARWLYSPFISPVNRFRISSNSSRTSSPPTGNDWSARWCSMVSWW